MTTLYKLTDENGKTYGDTQWGPNVTHTASGEGELCGAGWLHAYEDPLVAVFMNPAHGRFTNPRLWEAEGVVGKVSPDGKVGCTTLTTLREIPVPEVTLQQRIRFGILCALAVRRRWRGRKKWERWAKAWLDGSDRSAASSAAASSAAASSAAASSAASAAAYAAATAAATAAAYAACAACAAAASVDAHLDLAAIARQAVEEEA